MVVEQTQALLMPAIIAVALLLLETTLLTICFGFMSKNLFPLAKSESTRLLTLVISGIAVVFTITAGLISLDMGLDTSETACTVTYVLCAIFWLVLKSLVYLYFNEKLYLAKGVSARGRTAVNEIYFLNTVGLLLPVSFVIWILASFAYHKTESGKCTMGLTSFFSTLYLFLHNLVLNIYLSLSFIRLPPPSLQEMLRPNPAKYAWCNIATCIVPLAHLMMMLISNCVGNGWVFVGAALLDAGVAVVVLGTLEGWIYTRPLPPTPWSDQTCEDCNKLANNGENPGVNFFDLSLVSSEGVDGGKK